MKIWLKIALGILSGFASGFAAGFFTHKKINEIKFEEVSEEELDKLIAEIPEDIREKVDNKDNSDTSVNGLKRAEKALDAYGDNPDKLRLAMQGKTPYIDADDKFKREYSKMWETTKKYSNKENADNLPVPEDEESDIMREIDTEFYNSLDEIEEPPETKEPHKISLGEFYEERREYDKITIDWYDEDDTVLDEREEVIADPNSYVGCSMKELFSDPSPDGDPDAIYIRNDAYHTDYEIIRHHASCKKLIIGEDDSP